MSTGGGQIDTHIVQLFIYPGHIFFGKSGFSTHCNQSLRFKLKAVNELMLLSAAALQKCASQMLISCSCSFTTLHPDMYL